MKKTKYQRLEALEIELRKMMEEFAEDVKSIKEEFTTYKTHFANHKSLPEKAYNSLQD